MPRQPRSQRLPEVVVGLVLDDLDASHGATRGFVLKGLGLMVETYESFGLSL